MQSDCQIAVERDIRGGGRWIPRWDADHVPTAMSKSSDSAAGPVMGCTRPCRAMRVESSPQCKDVNAGAASLDHSLATESQRRAHRSRQGRTLGERRMNRLSFARALANRAFTVPAG